MPTTKITQGVPAAEVDALIKDYAAIGAVAIPHEQKDGNFSLTITFPGSARLARAAAAEAQPRV